MLTEIFTLCNDDPHARQFTYLEINQHYIWNKKDKQWKQRSNNQTCPQVPRILACNPREGEHYYLRMLLNIVKGPRSYEEVRTYNGTIHTTFKAAAIARGLLEDDQEWDRCMEEASHNCMAPQIRGLFAIILVYSDPTNPTALFQKHYTHMADDF